MENKMPETKKSKKKEEIKKIVKSKNVSRVLRKR